MKNFALYGKYYDLIYNKKNYKAETAYVISALKKNLIKGRRLVEFGAGTGNHLKYFEKHGFKVHGIERSPEMVSAARKKGYRRIYIGNIRKFRVPGKFSAVISLFHVMSYQIKAVEILDVFKNACAHLGKGGLFLFDFWYAAAVKKQKPAKRKTVIQGNNIKICRLAEPKLNLKKNIVEVLFKIKILDRYNKKLSYFEELHKMRFFTCKELDFYAQKAGMSRVCSEEFGTGRWPSVNTWGVCNIYKKL